MILLAPLFLLGLGALAIPVIIHLVHRQKPEGDPFPSLMFLQKIPHKAKRRQRIRHWLIFALRCAAIVLVVMAFTRPLFERSPDALAALAGGRDIAVLLDRSLSMGYEDRWERAVEAAGGVIDGMGPEDRVSIIAFDENAVAMHEPTADPLEARAALGQVQRSFRATRFGPAVKLAQNVLDQGDHPVKEVVIITDFQRTGWDRQDIVRFADNVVVTPVNVADGDAVNLAVAGVTVRQEPSGNRERAHLSARVINPGATPQEDVGVALVINDQVIQEQTVDLDPASASSVVFEPALLPVDPARAEIRLTADALPDDDVYHLVLVPGQAINVLVLSGTSAQPNQNLYTTRALEIGHDPSFRPVAKSIRNFRLSDLDGLDVLILNDAAMPGGQAGAAIRAFVEQGGGVLAALGTTVRGWPADMTDMLPGTIGARVEPRSSRGGTITQMDYGHQVFEPFNAPRSGDFTSARVFRYRGFDVVPDDAARVLARYDDGGVAVAERRVGEGRVMVLTTTLDTYWTNLPLQPVFLPFLHGAVTHLAGFGRSRPWFAVGAVADLKSYSERLPGGEAVAVALTEGADEVLVDPPASDRIRITSSDGPLFRVDERGFYELTGPDDVTITLAANVDPAESDLTPADVQEFVTSLAPVVEDDRITDVGSLLTPEDQEQRQAVWWYLLVSALLVFAVETLLSNRLSRVAQ